MKKTILMGLFVLSLTLTGCLGKEKVVTQEEKTPEVTNDSAATEEISDEPVNLSLSEWFEQQNGAKCSVMTPTGGVDTWVYGDKVRIEGVGFDPSKPEEIGHMLNDGEWIYTWAGLSGIKIAVKGAKDVADAVNTESEAVDWRDTVAQWENGGVEYSCEKTDQLSDEFFKAPEGIEFSDLSALLDVSTSSSESLMNNIPGNTEDVEAALEAAGITPVPDMPKTEADISE